MEIRRLEQKDYAGRKFTARYQTKGYYEICASEQGFWLDYRLFPEPVGRSFDDVFFGEWLEAPAAFGAVAMLVAAICVANTMMMSITERTREIGVLKVLGTTLGNISGLFLIEALLVGVFGGLMGLGLSFLMQKAIPFLFEEQQVRSLIPAWLAGFGVAFSGVMALLAAFIPARNAMRVSPNEAIRAQ